MRLFFCILGLAACSAEPAQMPSSATGGGASCTQSADAARHKVQVAIDANRACTTDADCTLVPAATSCFDSCTDVIAIGGEAAVEQSKASAEASECKAFAAAGCKLIAPPCVPPIPPTCRAGRCG